MNIVYLFGNGFDINLGMKTRYTDFYKNYTEKSSESSLVKNLKSNIFHNIENWSDLELALGKYTSEFQSVSEFDEVYEDILNNLCDYLDDESAKYDFSKFKKDVFLSDLCTPEKFLTEADIHEFSAYKRQWSSNDKLINIINFNYTDSISKILENTDSKKHLKVDAYSKYFFKELLHIHGFTSERTILGVNDISQVSNSKFHNDSDFIEALIKIESNSRQRHNVDKKCEKIINNANLICIFGCSLGETDKFWWKLIADNFKRGIKVIIFFRAEEQNQRFGHRPLRIQRMVKNIFWGMSDLSDEEKETYNKNLYIKINADIFNLF